jgi:alkylated DNA repair dioxygenase AlkB
MKRSKQTKLSSFFTNKKNRDDCTSEGQQQPSRKRLRSDDRPSKNATTLNQTNATVVDPLAEGLGLALNVKPQYLGALNTTKDSSWIIHVPRWFPSHKSPVSDFDTEWNLHPQTRKQLRIFGRWLEENRWSQAWGHSMTYSGMVDNTGRPIEESPTLPLLMEKVNHLMKDTINGSSEDCGSYHQYNACLQNWYTPEDSIGLHSDDEDYLYARHPIFSLSWRGTRRFVLRPKKNKKNMTQMDSDERSVEVWLEDGDLLIMGGACQKTHKHEVPKQRKRDSPTSNRISWTIRAIKTNA